LKEVRLRHLTLKPFNEGNRRNYKGQGKQWKGEDKNPHFISKQGQDKPHEDSPCPKRKDPETIDQTGIKMGEATE